jgi:hypothetical protein
MREQGQARRYPSRPRTTVVPQRELLGLSPRRSGNSSREPAASAVHRRLRHSPRSDHQLSDGDLRQPGPRRPVNRDSGAWPRTGAEVSSPFGPHRATSPTTSASLTVQRRLSCDPTAATTSRTSHPILSRRPERLSEPQQTWTASCPSSGCSTPPVAHRGECSRHLRTLPDPVGGVPGLDEPLELGWAIPGVRGCRTSSTSSTVTSARPRTPAPSRAAFRLPRSGDRRARRPQPGAGSAPSARLTSARRCSRKARSAAFAVSSIARRYDWAAPAGSPRRCSRSARVAGR